MTRTAGFAALCLALAGCATSVPTDAPTSAATCALRRDAELPAKVVAGAILVPAIFNRSAVQLEVDTGATASMVDQIEAARLWLPPDPHRRTTLHGTGGDVVTQNTAIRTFGVGGWQWVVQSLPTGELAHKFPPQDPPVAGLLGADRLSEFDVELDIPHGRMVLWNVAHCQGDFVPWSVPHFAIPLARHHPNRMVAQIAVNGHPVPALIDWGASRTIISNSVADSLGITPNMLARDRSSTNRGIDQADLVARLHSFDEVRIGREVFHHVGMSVAPVHLQEVGMLLGTDYARTRRIWLSYATGQMFVVVPRLASAAPQAPVPGAAPSH